MGPTAVKKIDPADYKYRYGCCGLFNVSELQTFTTNKDKTCLRCNVKLHTRASAWLMRLPVLRTSRTASIIQFNLLWRLTKATLCINYRQRMRHTPL